MRMIRLLAYVALGYFIYELYQGMTQGSGELRGGGQRAGSQDLARALNENSGRMNITGIGRGETVSVQGSGGSVSRETVGRGVVER